MLRSLKKILVLGSGALKIGEAGEFDYSGSQAIKAIKEEGIQSILVNPNIATIQTSEFLADQIYFLPITLDFVSGIIAQEKPDALFANFGGQTALQCCIDLHESGLLNDFHVEILGSPIESIKDTEDRERFIHRLNEIDVKVPASRAVNDVTTAVQVAEIIGFPVILRAAFALGGLGSGLCTNADQVNNRATQALAHSGQVLVEEYLTGWKELEYEVMRDADDNCITVCNMENIDPMGIHTGESLVVAPSQTLTNHEYHSLREIAIRVVRHLGIVGECNIQFALDPTSSDYRVIEVNARLSRSSALASKATGYPLAFVAAKLGLGHSLIDISNAVTGVTKAFFEPALDYVVVKAPRWDLQKFRKVSKKLGSQMKSVGEVMAIGRNFPEALQKALRMLKTGADGLLSNERAPFADLETELASPSHERIFAVAEAFSRGYSIDRVHQLSQIDKWFLHQIRDVAALEQELAQYSLSTCSTDLLLLGKQNGFSDIQLGRLMGSSEREVREARWDRGIRPFVKQIDTLAAEYPAQTNYLYLTYNSQFDDIAFDESNQIIVLGSGAYSIGSSVEFDWCSFNAVRSLRNMGYKSIVINYNPETVSTDFSESDKLYFDEISLETVLEIAGKESTPSIIVSVGGQTPNNLAMDLHHAGMKILGTSPESIDIAENRMQFSSLLDQLGIHQPEWLEATSEASAIAFAKMVGFPVIVRPSYVLSGAAMSVATTQSNLAKFLASAESISKQYPVVISKFIENAKELDIDAVARDGIIVASAISEHVENAGVHSGDATLVHPPQRTYLETIKKIQKISKNIASALRINGPFNIQFIAKGNQVYVIECNLRASRSLPFISKIQKTNFIDLATKVITGHEVTPCLNMAWDLEYVGVKAPQFSFTRLDGADPALGVEMASTGEVGCLGDDFDEAFLKALSAVGHKLELNSVLISTGPIEAKAAFLASARLLVQNKVDLFASYGTAAFLIQNKVPATALHWPLEKKNPNMMDWIARRKFDLVINIPKNYHQDELSNGYLVRRMSADFGVPLITNIQLAKRFIEALATKRLHELEIHSWQYYQPNVLSTRCH